MSVKFRMNLWGHGLSQNPNQKLQRFLPWKFTTSRLIQKEGTHVESWTSPLFYTRFHTFCTFMDHGQWSTVVHKLFFLHFEKSNVGDHPFNLMPPPTLYWILISIVIWGCYSQNDRFVQNWIQGLLWYHIRSEKLPKATFVTKKLLEIDRIGYIFS